jgi:flagellar biosynthesis/type III secretory pathway protein FliH
MYNGNDEFPDRGTYKLSDMFAELDREGLGSLELEVEVYNINEGRNAEMVKRSEALKGYSFFVSLLKEYGKTMDRDSAIERAARECISKNVLKEFLEEHASELLNMLYGWNAKEAREVEIEEAREEAREEGREEGREEERSRIMDLLKQGFSTEDILKQMAPSK